MVQKERTFQRAPRERLKVSFTKSIAVGQRCLKCANPVPLGEFCPKGCPCQGCEEPLEIRYDHERLGNWSPGEPRPGLEHYAQVLPPICPELSLGEGGTPLVQIFGPSFPKHMAVYVKDESQNPTWSHKDRLCFGVVSAAAQFGARGIACASTGNHGASAAAYAGRAGIPCILFCTRRPPALMSFVQAYRRQLVVTVNESKDRLAAVAYMVEHYGYHPATNYRDPPVNHPFGSEMYKTIAYELFVQLKGNMPAAVFVPVCYGELLFGLLKGFEDLVLYGAAKPPIPMLVSCELAAAGPLQKALAANDPKLTIRKEDRQQPGSDADSIVSYSNSFRAWHAMKATPSHAITVTDEEMRAAQGELADNGIWSELAAAASVAGLIQALNPLNDKLNTDGPIVCINTSGGFKDNHVARRDDEQYVASDYSISGDDWKGALDRLLAEQGLI